MVKGGARQVSASKAVAKGMGIPIFINVLKEINKIGDWVSIEQIHKSLHFGGERTETCRSYFKELWRHGLIERKEKLKIISCTPENWSKGGRAEYRISQKGRKLLKIPDKHLTFAIAWLLAKADNPQDFEQLYKTFETLKVKNLPLDYFHASELTGVVRDSIKALMYGWLEPLGFLDRVNGGKEFKLDLDYYNWLKGLNDIKEAIPPSLPYELETKDRLLKIKTVQCLHPASSEEDYVSVPFFIDYDGNKEIRLEMHGMVHRLLEKRFKSPRAKIDIFIKQKGKFEVILRFPLEKKEISESFMRTELGTFTLKIDNFEELRGALPTVFLTTKSDLHEYRLAGLLRDMGFEPIRLSKSDRPDAVIYPERKEKDLEKFLHNDEFKILVETSSVNVLTLAKVRNDLENFKEHTTKVLKINAERTLIVGNKIADNIKNMIPSLQKEFHPFTIVSMKQLERLRDYCSKYNTHDWSIIKSILCNDGIVEDELIEEVFSKIKG